MPICGKCHTHKLLHAATFVTIELKFGSKITFNSGNIHGSRGSQEGPYIELKKKSPDSPSHAVILGPRKLTQRFPSSLGAGLLSTN